MYERLGSCVVNSKCCPVAVSVEFMRANIVGTVIVLSLILWIPISCIVSWKDRKMKREEREAQSWLRADVRKHSLHFKLKLKELKDLLWQSHQIYLINLSFVS